METSCRTIRQLNVSEDGNLTIRFKGTTTRVRAKVIDRRYDQQGRLVYLCLDRLIHRHHEDGFKFDLPDSPEYGHYLSAEVKGCFGTEITLVPFN